MLRRKNSESVINGYSVAMSLSEDVIIVGAGPAGLAAAYHLQGRGVAYSVLEKGTVGWSWQHHYESLNLNSHKKLAALPGLAMPREYPIYPSRSEFVAYLQTYASRFSLRIRERTNVFRAVHNQSGWRLDTNRGPFHAKALIMATGVWSNPFTPEFVGSNDFKGCILHSKDYHKASEFVGKKVLIIGSGSSAVDIALDLARERVAVALAVRSGINLVPRTSSAWAVQFTAFFLKKRFTRALMVPVISLLRPDFSIWGLPQSPLSRSDPRYHPVVGYEIVEAVREKKVTVYSAVKQFFEHDVGFEDGNKAAFDVVIFATGYRPTLQLVKEYISLDSEGYPALDGCRSAVNPHLYCVGFSRSVAEVGGWLRTIGAIAAQAANQITDDLNQSTQIDLATCVA